MRHGRCSRVFRSACRLGQVSCRPGRWGTICAAVKQLGIAERALRASWSLRNYNFKGDADRTDAANAREQGAGDECADANIVERAILSPTFWSYRAMVHHLAEVLDHFLCWCESCACHTGTVELGRYDHRADDQFAHARRQAAFKARYGVKRCPLAGCRAADFANGTWLRIVQTLFNVAAVMVDLAVAASVSPADKAIIVRDFARARTHITFTCRLKFVPWEHLPMRAAGLADATPDASRRCAIEVVALYDQCPHKDQLHPACQKLLRPHFLFLYIYIYIYIYN